jgi:hypothetical protein
MSTRFVLGRYLDESVIIDSSTNYINATQLCANENRKLTEWQKTTTAKEQLKYFIVNMKCLAHNDMPSYEITSDEVSHMSLIGTIRNIVVGTYYHRYLINLLMQWLSPTYALKSSIIVDEYIKIRNEAKNTTTTTDAYVHQDSNRLKEVHAMVINIQELVNTIAARLDNDNTTISELSSGGSTVLIG